MDEKLMKLLLLLLYAIFVAYCCVPTNPGGIPTTTTTPPPGCCPPFSADPDPSSFANGILNATYDSLICRTTAVVFCYLSEPDLFLETSIWVNEVYVMDVVNGTSSIPATCDRATQMWIMGPTMELVVNTIYCRQADPGSTPGRKR